MEAKNCRAISPLTAFTIWVIMSYKIDPLFNHALPKTVWKVETHFSVTASKMQNPVYWTLMKYSWSAAVQITRRLHRPRLVEQPLIIFPR